MNFIQVGRIPFNQQITKFESTLNQLRNNGAGEVEEALAKSIFFVGMGSNDYLNNYLMPNYNTKNQYNPQEYATLLTQQYNQQLIRLCNLGARKFVIWWSRTNGVYSKYSCTKSKWCMFRGSESTCSSLS
ncbi:hypothetical protein AABB24_031387 [Solanum stoloniferum]|uniref:Zinc finger protein n=1 Tax=Solanum stoloniferum TaxID=62892 RepID=A0ABD2RWF3_9SOLN